MSCDHRTSFATVVLLLALGAGCRTTRPEPPGAPALVTPLDSADIAARATEERQRIARLVEESGSSAEPWTRAAAEVFAQRDLARGGAQLSSVRCFQRGCMATAIYADQSQMQRFGENLAASEGFLRWPGLKYRSPPEMLPDRRIATDWILFRPEEGATHAVQP